MVYASKEDKQQYKLLLAEDKIKNANDAKKKLQEKFDQEAKKAAFKA